MNENTIGMFQYSFCSYSTEQFDFSTDGIFVSIQLLFLFNGELANVENVES